MTAPRTLALSLGNTSLFAGVFLGEKLTASFRLAPDELFRLARRVPRQLDRAVLCSVVPAYTPDVLRFVRRTWKLDAAVLDATAPHGLKIGYRRPAELGADRVAAALGAQVRFPRQNVIVVDCGTATTVTALRRDGTLPGGVIFPGLALWPAALAGRTAQLPFVTLGGVRAALGRSPREAIASGVFFGHLGAMRETAARVRAEAFGRARALVVGTGGNAPLFADEKIFDRLEPHLVLEGLREFAARRASV
jgi:type III pantothenate kinase